MARQPATHRTPVSYIDRSREFYAAKGYDTPYRWASNSDAPFAPVRKPLSESRVAVVTTAFPVGFAQPKQAYAQAAHPTPSAMFTADLFWDKQATHTDDVATFLPLGHLRALADAGIIAEPSPRFYGIPTEYSQRRAGDDAISIERWVREDDVDLVLLVAL